MPRVGVGGISVAVEVSVGSSSVAVGNSKVAVTCVVGDGVGVLGKVVWRLFSPKIAVSRKTLTMHSTPMIAPAIGMFDLRGIDTDGCTLGRCRGGSG
jgi:hypothetical protein